MTFPDLEAAIAAAHDAGARVVVDNTVLSPLLLRPLEHGADFVLHSATKILAGHHDALVGRRRLRAGPRTTSAWRRFAPPPGSSPPPTRRGCCCAGIKTLAVRVERQSDDRARAGPPARRPPAGTDRPLPRPRRPGGRALRDRASGRCCPSTSPTPTPALSVERGLALIENATSLGGVASTLEARARWEGERVPPGLLRLSVGLEDVEDLWADLAQALDALA